MNTINSSPSFYGATQLFQKRILCNKNSFQQISINTINEYVGSLPNEIIKDIIKQAKTKKEKEDLIKFIMHAFSKTVKFINKEIDAERDNELAKVFYSAYAMFKKIKPNKIEDKYVIPYTHEEKNNIGRSASALLTTAFLKAGILEKSEKIDISYIGEGSFKNVFSIKFPQRTGYTPKVISIFKYIPKNYLDIEKTMEHGILPELNMVAYINKQHQKNSPFVRNYFGSITDNFILSDDANYLEPTMEIDERILTKMNLMHWDLSPENIVNDRIIDLGGLKMRDKHKVKPHNN